MIDTRDIPDFLPKYLTDHSYRELREAVRLFPDIAYDRFYSNYNIDRRTIYQGDCIVGLPFFREGKMYDRAKCFVLSNTCDMDVSENKRYFKSQIVFSPIVDAAAYAAGLKAKHPTEAIDSLFEDIQRQRASQVMYLPPNGSVPHGGLVFLDKVFHISSESIIRDELDATRLFSLSNYGHYCMCIKVSHHFCRITAQTDKPATLPTP